MIETQHTDGTCPNCQAVLKAATGPESAPEPGDYTVCLYCGAPCRYVGEALELVVLTEGDLAELTADARSAIGAAQRICAAIRREWSLKRECPRCGKKGRARRLDTGPPPATFVCGSCGEQWQDVAL